MFRFSGLSLLSVLGSSLALAQQHAAPKTSSTPTTAATTTVNANDAQVIAIALAREMGDSCTPGDSESPRVRASLANMRNVSNSMISQFTKMVQDEIAEKQGPLKIGPPEIMNQMIESMGSISEFNKYNYLRTQNPRRHPTPETRISSMRDQAKALETQFVAKLAGTGGHSALDLHRAGELANELSQKIYKPFHTPSRGQVKPTANTLWGHKVSEDRKRYFSSLEDVSSSLSEMNKYLASEAEGLQRDTMMVNAVADGLALSVPTALIGAARVGLGRVTATGMVGAVKAGTSQGVVGDSIANQPGKVLMFTTFVQAIRSDLQNTLLRIGNKEVLAKTKEVIGLGPEPASKVGSEDPEADGAGDAKPADHVGEVVLSQITSRDGRKIEVPYVKDPSEFTNSIMSIREATKEYLHSPKLLRNKDSDQALASSALNATLSTLADTRTSNDALMLNMQSFYNTSQRARADYAAMATLDAKSKIPGAVSRLDISKLAATLDSDVNLMLEKMDDSTSILANQSENFSRGLAAIDAACEADALKIYESWGKYRRVFRDKLGVSPFGGQVSPSLAYLADAVLARADCVMKKSIARRMEMMRLGTVLTQFKSSCEDIKNWSSANQAYRYVRERMISEIHGPDDTPEELKKLDGATP